MSVDIQRNTIDPTASTLGAQGSLNVAEKDTNAVAKGIQAKSGSLPDVDVKALQSLMGNPALAPKASTAQATDPEVEANLKRIEQILNSPLSSDTSRLLGRLMVELGALQRKEALNDRLLARLVARAELQAGAEELKDAADKTEKGAKLALIITAIASIATMAMSAYALKGVASSIKTDMPAKAPTDGGKLALQPPPGAGAGAGADASSASHMAAARLQTINVIGGTVSSMGQAGSTMANSKEQSGAQIDQAENAEFQAEAEVTRSEGELESSEQQDLHEFITQMIQFIKELREIEAEELGIFAKG